MIFEKLVLLFFILSFAGWVIELCFRSVYEKRFVNPGFHKGPWLPLYGSAGIIIFLVSERFTESSILIRMVFYLVLCTVLEFVAGVFMEKMFHKRYWDYSKNFLNLKGLICPLYSFAWVIISIIVEAFILPDIKLIIASISFEILQKMDAALLLIFAIDFNISSGIISNRYISRIKGLFS